MAEEELCCPLCMEDMDVTDRNFRPCKCGYQICLFCYRHIKEDLNGLCPACRTPYDEANVTFVTPDPQEMARMAREKKAKELKDKKEQQAKEAKEKREAELKSRQEAQARAAATAAAAATASAAPVRAATAPATAAASTSAASASCSCGPAGTAAAAAAAPTARPIVKQPLQAGRQQEQLQRDMALRTTQRAIVYVMGLSPRIAKEEILRRHDYFGQYGKIMRIQVSPAGAAATSGPPSLRCCITYATREEAEQAVLAVDNVVLDGRTLKASFGMPKPAAPGPAMGGGGEAHEEKEEAAMKEEPGSGRYAAAERAPTREAAASGVVGHGGPDRGGGGGGSGVGGPPERASWEMGHGAAVPPLAAPSASASAPLSAAAVGSAALAAVGMPPEPPTAVPDAPVRAPGPAAVASANDLVAEGGHGASMGAIGAGANRMRTAPEPARGGSSLLSGQPTGSEPWSMMGGSFEDLLNGLVTDEPEEEEATLPGSSRFARFFDSSTIEENGPPSGGASALASLGGIKLDAPFETKGAPNHDWQQGFRALLPNVNISFSPFGDAGGAPQADGLAAPGSAAVGGGSALGAAGGLGGLAGFGGFGPSAVGSLAPQGPSAAVGPVSAPFSAGGSAGLCGSSFESSFEMPGGLSTRLGSAALNGGAGLPGLGGPPPSASGDVSLLQQLSSSSSGPLPGVPGTQQHQLSSQLQSLLAGTNGSSAAVGSGRAVGGGGEAHMPGWDGLLPKGGDEQPKEQSGGSSARKKEGGGNERGGKGKKRGGTSNRGGKTGEAKPPPAHNGK